MQPFISIATTTAYCLLLFDFMDGFGGNGGQNDQIGKYTTAILFARPSRQSVFGRIGI
jgi:hypothetical protein